MVKFEESDKSLFPIIGVASSIIAAECKVCKAVLDEMARRHLPYDAPILVYGGKAWDWFFKEHVDYWLFCLREFLRDFPVHHPSDESIVPISPQHVAQLRELYDSQRPVGSLLCEPNDSFAQSATIRPLAFYHDADLFHV